MNQVTFLAIILAITNSIRGLAPISERPIFLLIPVDALPCMDFDRFNQGLIRSILNNLSAFGYPAKNRWRAYTGQVF